MAADAKALPLLEAEGVEVEIGGTPILRGADLRLGRGELVAVVGPNGAGKSTLVRAVSGLQPLSAGRCSGRAARSAGCAAASWPGCAPSCRSGCRCPAGVTVREAVTIGRSSHLRTARPPDRRRPRRRSSARWSAPRSAASPSGR